MDEEAKTEARNYLSAAGFFLLGGYWLLYLLMNLSPSSTTLFISSNYIELAVGVGLFIVSTLLMILRKRDMMAILFFLMGTLEMFWTFIDLQDRLVWNVIFSAFVSLAMLVALTVRDRQKWLLFVIPVAFLIEQLIRMCWDYSPMVYIVSRIILVAICFYLAFACASEKIPFPGYKLLTANEQTDFKMSGPALGYMLFSIITGGYALYYMFAGLLVPLESFVTIELVCDCLMVFVSVLLFAIAKMRFTPVMFLLMGILGIWTVFSDGSMFIGVGVLWIILGLFAMLRKESRVMSGVMLLVYGCSCFFTAYADGLLYYSPAISAVLNVVPCIIAIYLSFTVYSRRKLALF